MPPYYPLADPPRRTPAGRLGSLREALDDLGQQLRSGVADTVAQTVAGVARDMVLALLSGRHSRPTPAPARPLVGRPPALWEEGGETPDNDGGALPPAWDDPEPERWPVPQPPPSPAAPSRPSRWLSALSAGGRAGRWWLGRGRGRFPLLAAVGVGLATGLGALLVGSLVPAGAGLVGSALHLASLADVARPRPAPPAALAP